VKPSTWSWAAEMSARELDAIILCGGLGTRLRQVVADRPKSMAIVRGRPFLEWLLLALIAREVRRVVLATGYLGEAIEERFGNGQMLGLDLVYSRESRPLGTAGSMRLAASAIKTSPILVMNGDTYCNFDLEDMLKLHRTQEALATIWLQEVELAERFGAVELAEDGLVRGFREKVAAPRGLVNAGVYLVQRRLIDRIPPDRMVSLEREIFPSTVGHGLYALVGKGTFVDIGTPESLEKAGDILNPELDRLEKVYWTSA
jgi:D-glycero-alpha-D-manno-heptose 1-phosphate guanylyltransferase